ncbi:MAG: NifB/NifX family molybdenum-iron cluster-binding protein [Anaerolineae bacterium]
MRIVVSAMDDRGLDSLCSPHFGRCPYFVSLDVQDDVVEAVRVVPNPYYGNHQPGQVPALIAEMQAQVMLSGGMGARAVDLFHQYGIEPVTGAAGTVRDALSAYLTGALQGAAGCSHEHSEHEGEHDHACGETPASPDADRLRAQVQRLEGELGEVENRLSRLRKGK